MSENDGETFPITRLGYFGSAFIGVAVLAATLAAVGWWMPNAWWFYVAILAAYLIADVLTLVYDRVASRTRRQYWIPVKFIAFVIAILLGAVIGLYAVSRTSNGLFTAQLTVGVYGFWGLNIVLPALLYLDFILRGRFRRTRPLTRYVRPSDTS